jgi:DNA-binding PadR family transcriptional regulator
MRGVQLCLLVILMVGCSGDPKAASKANFEKAAKKKFAEMEQAGDFCIGPETVPYQYTPKWMDSKAPKLALQKLEKLGLLQAMPSSEPRSRDKVYDLTDQGKLYFEANRGFCFVRPEVVEVSEFTEPADLQGKRVSSVTLLMRTVPVKPDPDFVKLASEINPAIHKEAEAKTVRFVLTSEGWQSK